MSDTPAAPADPPQAPSTCSTSLGETEPPRTAAQPTPAPPTPPAAAPTPAAAPPPAPAPPVAAPPTTAPLMAGTPSGEPAVTKLKVQFKATGSAPILRKKKFLIPSDKDFSAVIAFLRGQLRMHDSDVLYLYLNSAFRPCPDESVLALFECFNVGGELLVNYSTAEAWG